jgi:hypothetical protein
MPVGETTADSEEFRFVLSGLGFFLPGQVLNQVYPNFESLDGIWSLVARKTGDGKMEILGLCTLMSDQCVTPIHIRLQVARRTDEISWLECRLGERGKHGMIRTPYDRADSLAKRLYLLDGKPELIDWVYKVTFGERRSR